MRRILALAFVLAVSNTAAFAAERTLNIAATEFPPYYGKDLENNGFLTEIIREAFARGGYDLEINFLPWKRALEGAKRGKYDALYSVWHRPEREEWFVFSDALPANELGFFKHKSKDISFGSYDSLNPYTIGGGQRLRLTAGVRGSRAQDGFGE